MDTLRQGGWEEGPHRQRVAHSLGGTGGVEEHGRQAGPRCEKRCLLPCISQPAWGWHRVEDARVWPIELRDRCGCRLQGEGGCGFADIGDARTRPSPETQNVKGSSRVTQGPSPWDKLGRAQGHWANATCLVQGLGPVLMDKPPKPVQAYS